MNVPPSDADRLDLPTYNSILSNWNEMHARSDDVEAPDPEIAMAVLEKANRDERLIH